MAMTLDGTSGITQMTGSIVMSGSTSGTTTIIPSAVAGTTTVTMPAATGTMMVSGNMPAFSAYLSTNQSLTTATATKYAAATERFDTASCFNNTGSTVGSIPAYAFLPNVAGYYQIAAGNWFTSASGNVVSFIYKNGSVYTASYNQSTNGQNSNVFALIYMNGTTDYVEAYFRQDTGSTQALDSSSVNIGFYGYMVRSA